MKTLLILSSILGDRSHSKELADHFVARTRQFDPDGAVVVRDLANQPVPYFDGNTVGALFTPADARTAEQREVVAFSDSLVAELFDADRIVFAVPVYNFNLPAQLKSYIDYVARAGITFRYTEQGVPEGLVKGKQVVVLISRGGKAEGTPDDNVTPYLRQMLNFLGMEPTFIAAEGMAMGELAVQEGVALARQRIDALDLAAAGEAVAA
ncbi:acyl carrier protein phosphodiesterase [Bordetella ansorpii]|uniref:FMN dependent NADH:quinone oxidoreductase n=1 Tax=Bordetella ansorpii TaxID=288768 RepID=A0A157QIW2_9BORD|nr:NAD(P)H-dependent oxidoreductase [Bordetella ansorpii]SAI45470.1 acyl carrier protein phosphodiesterase [Bordetella ansorpii]